MELDKKPPSFDLEKLSDKFQKSDIKFRPGAVYGDKALALAYVDSRAIQKRFDSVVGMENWQNRHICYSGKSDKVVCEIGVRINGEWVFKADGAGDSQVEGEKGSFSDALKRAAVLWGVGRYLYYFEATWVPFNAAKKRFGDDPWNHIKNHAALCSDSGAVVAPAKGPSISTKDPDTTNKLYVPYPEEDNKTKYASILVGMIKNAKTFVEFGEIRLANKDGLERLDKDDKKLRGEIKQASIEKSNNLKKPPPNNGDQQ